MLLTEHDHPIVALDRLDQIEAYIQTSLAERTIEPVHRFADGLYAREITIPADTFLTGEIHKTRHMNIISKGRILVFDELAGWKVVTAPCTFVAEPGTRRFGITAEETVWTTIHATTETEPEKLREQLIESRENPLLEGVVSCHGLL